MQKFDKPLLNLKITTKKTDFNSQDQPILRPICSYTINRNISTLYNKWFKYLYNIYHIEYTHVQTPFDNNLMRLEF